MNSSLVCVRNQRRVAQKAKPEHCSVPVLLRYLKTLLDKGLALASLKVYVAANSAGPIKSSKSFITKII